MFNTKSSVGSSGRRRRSTSPASTTKGLSKDGDFLPENHVYSQLPQPRLIRNLSSAGETSHQKENMPVVKVSDDRGSIPIIYVRGTYFQVGFEVGRTFGSMIQSYLEKHTELNATFIPLYQTEKGRSVYDATLVSMKKNYPHYIRELEGTAEGAKVPFYKLFLLHIDDILPGALGKLPNDLGEGCSSVMCKLPGKEILGHNEDALSETLNHFYFVDAHIISDEPQGKWGTQEERFTSLCYAGNLPGFTMSYNHHGLVYSVNIICVKSPKAGKTPRTFLTRSLLAAQNMKQAEQMIRDVGLGVGNGVSLNMAFLNEKPSVFYNAEVGPPSDKERESSVNIIPVKSGECFYHCNRFLRLDIQERKGLAMESSINRHEVMDCLPEPKCMRDVINILGDESNCKFPLYRADKKKYVATIATGVFNCTDLTWSIYSDNPKHNEPLMVLPLNIKV